MNLNAFLQQQLRDLDAQQLRRRRRIIESAQGATLQIDGRVVHNFCSNDYLGLANHPAIQLAFKNAVDRWGVGSGASHLVTGHSSAHQALEEKLADFVGRDAALCFSTGWMANTGVITALVGAGDRVFEDKLNHASLIDGGLSSQATFKRYAHNDVTALQRLLDHHSDKNTLVVTDSVFSMDGDCAPLADLAAVCAKQTAWLMVDDAHGFGVLGEHGRGALPALKLNQHDVPILMCTLGKAIGTAGAFVAGSSELIDFLLQRARPYIYSTAMPAAIAVATSAAIDVVQNETWRQTHLQKLIRVFRDTATDAELTLMPSSTAIQPLVLGSNARALAASELLLQRGFLVSAIRPPTVPKGSARLRVTLSAAHDENTVRDLVAALVDIVEQLDALIPDHDTQ